MGTCGGCHLQVTSYPTDQRAVEGRADRQNCGACMYRRTVFRAHGLRAGLFMFFNIIWGFSLSSFGDGTVFNVGMDKKDFLIAFIGVLIVLVNSIMKEKGTRPRKWLADRPVVFRWALCYGLILFVVIFGAYGAGYVPLDPIYANF